MTLSLTEIARRLGMKRGTVWAAKKRNAFKWTQSGKTVLAELEDVKAYFATNRNSKKKS